MPKITAAVAALLLVLALAGCGDDGATGDTSSEQSKPTSQEASETPTPLTAQPTDAGGEDVETFLEFVHGRMATFKTQIPDATDEQLEAAGREACERLLDGESYELMSVIDGEELSEPAGYYFDSNAIIAGAQMHLCPETLEVPDSGDSE